MVPVFKDQIKRKEAIRKLAYPLGMRYRENDTWKLRTRLRDFKLFRKGRHRKIFNLLQRRDHFFEEQFHVFDYRYVKGSNKSRHRHFQTVFFIQSKYLGLPDFLMKPESFFHKVGAYLGMQDIDFAADEKYSGQYLLQGEDEVLVRKMMKENLRHFFTVEQDWCVEGLGYYLIFYKENVLIPPAVIEQFVQKGLEVYEMLRNGTEPPGLNSK